MASKFDKCIKALSSVANKAFTKAEATALMQKLQETADGLGMASAEQKLLALREAAGEFAEQSIMQAKVAKMRISLNAMAAHGLLSDIRGFNNDLAGAYAMWKGAEDVQPGAHQSIPAQLKGATELVAKQMAGELLNLKSLNGTKGDIVKMLLGGKTLDRSIAWHLSKASKPEVEIPDNIPPVERDAGRQVAEVMKKYQTESLNRLNLSGCNIVDLAGRIVRRQHDPLAMRKMGRDAWIQLIKPLISKDTYRGADSDKFLGSVYDAQSSGIRLSQEGKPGQAFQEYAGNMAAKLSKRQLLTFNDPDAELNYRKAMGSPYSLFTDVFHEVTGNTRDAALMQRLGPDPTGTWGQITQQLLRDNRTNHAMSDKLNSAFSDNGRITNIFKTVTGFTAQDLNPNVSRIYDGLRTFLVGTTQWLSTIKSLPDVAAGTVYLNHWGVPIWKSMSDFAEGWSDHFGATKGNAFEDYNRQSWFFAEHMMQNISSDFRDTQGQRGWSRKVSNLVYTANQQMRWDAENRYTIAQTVSRVLGHNADKPLTAITDKDVLRSLYKYGIDGNTWDTIRQAKYESQPGGDHTYLTAEGVQGLPDSAIAEYMKNKGITNTPYALEKARNELATKVSTIFTDAGDHIITLAGANEQAIMNQGLQKGTHLRGMADLFFQFRGYSLASSYRTFASMVYGRGDASTAAALRSKWASLYYGAEGIATGMALWYISDTIKNALLGVGPRTYNAQNGGVNRSNIQNGITALAGSGGLGPYADLATSNVDSDPAWIANLLLGPAFKKASEASYLGFKSTIGLATSKAEGNKKATFPFTQDTRFAEDSLPGISFPPLKMALNWLILNRLQNKINPKANQQHEKALYGQTHQTYFFPASKK